MMFILVMVMVMIVMVVMTCDDVMMVINKGDNSASNNDGDCVDGDNDDTQ